MNFYTILILLSYILTHSIFDRHFYSNCRSFELWGSKDIIIIDIELTYDDPSLSLTVYLC